MAKPTEIKEDKLYRHLLQKSRELFLRYGVKSLTMDDIAREMGMSKKTIYQYVENKADLVRKTTEGHLNEERRQMEAIVAKTENSVEEMIEMVAYFLQVMREFNGAALHDLRKYYPETWEMYNEYRYDYVLKRIIQNLETGKEQGLYRSELNADIIARIYVSAIEILLDRFLFPQEKYTLIDTYREFINYHLRGILSAKGLALMERHNLFQK